MVIDASKLKRRKGLGAPPTGGTPGMEPDLPYGQTATDPNTTAMPVLEVALPSTERQDIGGAVDEVTATSMSEPLVMPHSSRVGVETVSRSARQRVPPREAEPRVPFTTRVTAGTKERLENACYHLRSSHQDFINDAISEHLEKHGF